MYAWTWSIGGMMHIGGNQSTQRKASPSASLLTTNATWTGLGSNMGLHSSHNMTGRPDCLTESMYIGDSYVC
jgi:hypothetical protein